MLGARFECDAAEDLRISHIVQGVSAHNIDFSKSPTTPTKGANVVAFNVRRMDDGSCDAHMCILKTDSDDESDGADEGLRH